MGLRNNFYYWEVSLQNPEPLIDDYYTHDQIIVEDENLIENIERLRELITAYCVVLDRSEDSARDILEEIFDMVVNVERIQYTEFVAFWKAMDLSYSVFESLPISLRKSIFAEILKRYCRRRRKIYEKTGYSNMVVQALYDSSASRRTGVASIFKLVDLMEKTFGKIYHVKDIHMLTTFPTAYFLPDKGDKLLFDKFLKRFRIRYRFGRSHQGKRPDVVLKVGEHFFIIEAKHIKESGGAQNKQITELIRFVSHSEENTSIHYLAFMDGIYFNRFIPVEGSSVKMVRQRKSIEKALRKNSRNFFVNTAGFKTLMRDLYNGV